MTDLAPGSDYAPAADLLTGRQVLVTGAGSGLGRALSLALARHGATVLLSGRRARPLESTYDAIAALGLARPALLPFDLENALAGDYDRLVEAVDAEFGGLDALVHCAAILGTRAPIEHYDVPTWCRVVQVNLTAAFALTQGLLPLLSRRRGHVLFSTCDQGQRGTAYFGAYAVAKAGLERLAETLADETEGTLKVHSVDPGPLQTGLRLQVFPAEGGTVAPSPEHATRTYLWLLDRSCPAASGSRITIPAP
jgi:NAD(P)-dependent dehydrogenase (short-subunit alcohol dehydrogenase family)